MKRFLLAAFLVLLPGHASASPGTDTFAYAKLFNDIEPLFKGNYDRLTGGLLVRAGKGDPALAAPVTITVSGAPDGVATLAISSQNIVTVPYRPDWVKEKVTLTINQAPRTYEFTPRIGMVLPEGASRIPYADVKAAFDQMDALLKSRGLFWMSSKLIRIFCGQDCTVTLEGAKDSVVLKADKEGRVNIPNDKALAANNPVLVVNKPIYNTSISTSSK